MSEDKADYSQDYFSLDADQRKLSAFKSSSSEEFGLAQDVYVCSRWLVDSYLQADFGHFIEHFLIQYIQKIFHHSMLQCMVDNPQIALASGRIAVESCRDLFRILESEENRELYLLQEPTKQEIKKYRKLFRFDEESDEEQALYALYNFGSEFGIHARYLVGDAMGEVVPSFDKNFKVATQKNHSKKVIRLLVVCQFYALNIFCDLRESLLNATESALIYLGLYQDARNKMLPRLLNMDEFKFS